MPVRGRNLLRQDKKNFGFLPPKTGGFLILGTYLKELKMVEDNRSSLGERFTTNPSGRELDQAYSELQSLSGEKSAEIEEFLTEADQKLGTLNPGKDSIGKFLMETAQEANSKGGLVFELAFWESVGRGRFIREEFKFKKD